MKDSLDFEFGASSVALAYDTCLVPIIFKPWATKIIESLEPWAGKTVMDLAAGTGVVTEQIARKITENGKVIAYDLNSQMLEIAKNRCSELKDHIEFIVGSALELKLENDSMDTVVCQQGFQFFPNKNLAATEIYRVLKTNGNLYISTWCPVKECHIFGAICEALESIDQIDISTMMRVPFDLLDEEGLRSPFQLAGFKNVAVKKEVQELTIPEGTDKIVDLAYATPIGPKLMELNEETQTEFKRLLIEKATDLGHEKINFGSMVSYVLTAVK